MIKVGVVGVAHVHAPSFVHCFMKHTDTEVVGVYDADPGRAKEFAESRSLPVFDDLQKLFELVDAVVICSENMRHEAEIIAAAAAGKSILCEKPVAATSLAADKIEAAVKNAGVTFMVAFPCPFSPAFQTLAARIQAGEIGDVLAICSTNQGSCPFGWFVDKSLAGGGAMIDHTVHVADLISRLLGKRAQWARASIGNGMYDLDVDDTALLTIGYEGGVFATLDASWSKKNYKIWGNVSLKIVGTKGTAECDLFSQGADVYATSHFIAGVGADLDALMVDEFVQALVQKRTPKCTIEDGLHASRVALAAYLSVRQHGIPCPV